jgi:hypothetical protein
MNKPNKPVYNFGPHKESFNFPKILLGVLILSALVMLASQL